MISFHRVLSLVILMLLINTTAYVFAQSMPQGLVGASPDLSEIYGEFNKYQDINIEQIQSNQNNTAFDPGRGFGIIQTLGSIFLGGDTIASLLGLSGSTYSTVVWIINGFQTVLYILLLLMLFLGR